MSSEQHKRMFRMVIEEALNNGHFDALDELFAPAYGEHQFGLKPTLAGMKEDFAFLRRAFPDLHLTIDDMIANDDMVWGRMTARGTNLGPFMGPPTGKRIEITVIDILRFKDGLIVDHWGSPDRFAAMAQLGLLPQPK
jgi:predicted ester cyclase